MRFWSRFVTLAAAALVHSAVASQLLLSRLTDLQRQQLELIPSCNVGTMSRCGAGADGGSRQHNAA